MTSENVVVSTAQVRLSADQMAVVAGEASSSRAAVADSVSTQGAAWKEKATPGFGKFIDVLEGQAARLRSDLTALGEIRCAQPPMSMTNRTMRPAGRSTVRCGTTRSAGPDR